MLSIQLIQEARNRIAGRAHRTPAVSSRLFNEVAGRDVFFKCENLQRTGSFKIRGATNKILSLGDEERQRGVVAFSSGNHAQAVAVAAAEAGVRSVIAMPVDAPKAKIAATRAYGARVHLVGETIDGSIAAATEFAGRTGAVFVHPFDHRDIIAGQGTVGLELLEQVPDVRTVLVCTGGGGLLGGIAAAVKEQRPDVAVVGVQAAGAAAWPPSLAAGEPLALKSMRTIADGIAVGQPGKVTFPQVA